MTQPTELEKKIADRLFELRMSVLPTDADQGAILLREAEEIELFALLRKTIERRLMVEYLGQSSVTGRDSSQERID